MAESGAVLNRAVLETQFADLEQQRETATFGMWVFLATELLLFGALFLAYTVYRYGAPEGFADASQHMEKVIGAVNTAVLLSSSFMVATAVRGAQVGGRKRLLFGLALTIVLGVVFLFFKGYEYYLHYEDHKVPGLNFEYAGQYAQAAKLFFFFYFAMTGLHAVHMLIGLGLVSVMLVRSWRGVFTEEYHAPVEVVGLYWHFVDLVWIFLFPVFYLIVKHH
ncbi:MAG TPA: cytochrome c oxidase subunit 3 [Pyrinomonadaceae bacterium]|nr:cytochrome c oxidase subunit 3 [Pyrinomonadaceae bacterium]